MPNGKRNQGFTYLTALLLVAVVGAGLAATSSIWSQTRQREKEAELLWIGSQFTQAIALYYQRTPGSAKRYPDSLDELLEDKRSLSVQRYLRKVYVDPMTGKNEWGLMPAAEGGIMGVFSLSGSEPIKSGNFALRDKGFESARRYSDWKFTYMPSTGTATPSVGQPSPSPTKRGSESAKSGAQK